MFKGRIHFSTCIYTTQMLSLLNSLELVFLNCAWSRFGFRLLLLINLYQLVSFEQSFFLTFAWQYQKSLAFLNSIHPLTFIACSIKPIHLSKPTSNILFIIPFIYISSCPAKNSISMFFILKILSFIFIAIPHSFFPHTMSFSQSIFKQSFIIASIRPIILTVSVRLSSSVLTLIQITICEFLGTLTMLQAIFETSLVSITIDPYMYSVSLCFTEPPFTDITISFYTFPHSRTMLQTVNPFTFIKFTVCPSVLSDSFGLAVNILSIIVTTIGKFFISQSLLVISLPISFIDPIVVIDHDALTMTFAINNLPIISSFSIFFELQIR